MDPQKTINLPLGDSYITLEKKQRNIRWIFENVFVWLICCWKCSMCFMFEYHCLLLSTDDMVFWKSPLSGAYIAENHLLNITPRFFKVTSFGPIAVTFSGLSDLEEAGHCCSIAVHHVLENNNSRFQQLHWLFTNYTPALRHSTDSTRLCWTHLFKDIHHLGGCRWMRVRISRMKISHEVRPLRKGSHNSRSWGLSTYPRHQMILQAWNCWNQNPSYFSSLRR